MPTIAYALDYDDAALPAAGKTENLYAWPPAAAQAGATAHWVFDRGGEGSLIDLVDEYELTPQADTYGFGRASLTIAGAVGNALLTPFDDAANTLFWFVARRPLLANSAIFAGTLGGVDMGGFGVHQVAATASIYARQRVQGSGEPAKSASIVYGDVDVGDWFFGAGYTGSRAVQSDNGVTVFRDPASFSQAAITPATADVIAGRKIALGNGYYNGQGAGTVLEFAEFGIMAGVEMTAAKGAEIYADAQARLASRGIVI